MGKSLFDKLGGQDAVDAAVSQFYPRVLNDPRIKGFFDGVDMARQARKQKNFLAQVFGGPKKYTGKSMRAGHAHLIPKGLSDEHFNAVLENLTGTLRDMGVEEELITEVEKLAESTREDVLNR